MHAAGEHGIRIIFDLVMHHTSNEHPWFKAARRAHRSRFRDYYVWSQTPPDPAKAAEPYYGPARGARAPAVTGRRLALRADEGLVVALRA